jgi:hypothetical protein
VDVIVSVGRGVKVKVGEGVNVSVDGMAVNVAVDETLVDVLSGAGEGEAVCPPPETVQDRMMRVSRMGSSRCLYFTP